MSIEKNIKIDKKKPMIILTSVATMVIAFEGLRQISYKDEAKVKTVCYGHTGSNILDKKYSINECNHLLEKDVKYAYDTFQRCIGKAPDSVVKAYTSAIYNIGNKIVCTDTDARKYLKKKQYLKACYELSRWNKVNGKINKGLVKRRDKEKLICLEYLKKGG